jgi:hypothetical protein
MPIVRPALKINMLKMEQVFFMVIKKGRGCFMFPQQTCKVKKNMCAITLILGVRFGKRKMQKLKNSWLRIRISVGYMEECFTFGTAIIAFKLGDHILMRTIPTNPNGT